MTMNEEPITTPQTLQDRIYAIWEAIDWSKSNIEIAGELECNYLTVSKWREKITGVAGKKQYGKGHDVDWDKVDWAKNNSLLSRELGVSAAIIGYTRNAQNRPFPTVHRWTTKFTDEDISSVDWAFTRDVEIARKFGISRERVRQIRAERQLPDCKVSGIHDANRIAVLKWCHEHRAEIEGKSMLEVSNMVPEFGLKRTELYKLFHKTKFKFSPNRTDRGTRGFDWKSLNWDLSDIVLAMIYGFPRYRLPPIRYEFKYQKPKWWMGGGFNRHASNPEFLAAVEAELIKAKAKGIDNESRVREWLKYKQDAQNRNWRRPVKVDIKT